MKKRLKWVSVLLSLYFFTFLFISAVLILFIGKNLDQNRLVMASIAVTCLLSGIPAIAITRAFQLKTERFSALVGSFLYLVGLFFFFLPLQIGLFFEGLVIVIFGSLVLGMCFIRINEAPIQ